MIRLYKETARDFLVALTILRYRVGYNLADCWRATRDLSGGKLPDGVFQILKDRVEVEGGCSRFEDLMLMLVAALQQESTPSPEGDLIDHIVDILKLPYPRNCLSGNQLRDLKTTLLLPEEITVVNTRLKQQESSCASCGHVLTSGEMVTFFTDGRDRSFSCTRCQKPVATACDKCRNGTIPASKRLMNALAQPLDCGCPHEEVKQPEEPGLPGRLRARTAEMLRHLDGPAFIGQPRPPEVIRTQLIWPNLEADFRQQNQVIGTTTTTANTIQWTPDPPPGEELIEEEDE